jgi:hypothetical protein
VDRDRLGRAFTTLVDGSALGDLAPSGADVQTECLCFVGRHP